MQVRTLVQLSETRTRQQIAAFRAIFLKDSTTSFFAGQPVSVTIAPSVSVPSSVHCMYFPPGLTQPQHRHPGDRLLVVICSSRVNVDYAESVNSATARAQIEANSVGTIQIPTATWHAFSCDPAGHGAVAFSFHPHDQGEEEVLLADDLMQRLTEFRENG